MQGSSYQVLPVNQIPQHHNQRSKQMNIDTITINGEEWVRKSSIPPAQTMAANVDGLKYCIVRTHSAGVFAGYVKERKGTEATVLNARRIWYWNGAASLSELAMHGVSRPQNCKFPCEVTEVILTEVIEVIPATEKARESINGVKVWTAQN